MNKQDLKGIKLPLTKITSIFLKNSIRSGQLKWMDMSKELMYSYQDFWKFKKYKNIEDILQD